MNDKLLYQATEYEQAHSRKRRWHKVVTAMAAVVVFCTTYALILPAITMSDTVYCGYEEAHTEECWVETPVLGCGLCPEGHTHTESCYETQTKLICELEESEEHSHSDACYETEEILICGSEEYAPHEHTEECWTVERELICGKETHTHTLQCYSDPTADVQTPSTWELSFADVELSGEWREDVLAIAETQLGYMESARNYRVAEDGTTKKGYTIYGDWYGDPYGDWCAMFCSFCLHYAGVDADLFPQGASCSRWVELLEDEEYDLYRPAEDYEPKPGDLIFFDHDEDPDADHVGIVAELTEATESEPAQIKTIEGNNGRAVAYHTYDLDDESILGYGELSNGLSEREYRGEDFTVYVSYGRNAGIPEEAELAVCELLPDTEEFALCYQQTLETLKAQDDQIADIGFIRFFDVSFLLNGEELEPDTSVNVRIVYDDPVILDDNTAEMSIHFADSGIELPETSVSQTEDYAPENSVNTFEFTTESFSVIGAGTVTYEDRTGTYYQKVDKLEVGQTYLIVSAEGSMALRNNINSTDNTNNYQNIDLLPVKGWPGYYTADGTVDGRLRWGLLAPSGTSAADVYRLQNKANTGVYLRLGGDTVVSNSTNTTANRNTLFEYDTGKGSWTLRCNSSQTYYLLNSGEAFSRGTSGNIARQFVIYKEVNTTLSIPSDVAGGGYNGGEGSGGTQKPTYPEDAKDGLSGAIQQRFTDVSVPAALQNEDGTIKWAYASDPATSKIEQYYQANNDTRHYNDVMQRDGMVRTDKSVIFGHDDYNAFNRYDPGEFSAALSAMGQDYHLQIADQVKIPVDVMFILDVSGSMKTEFSGETRLQALVKATNNAIRLIMEENPNNRVGIALYSSGGELLLPLDHYDYNHSRAFDETNAYVQLVSTDAYDQTGVNYVQPSSYVRSQKGIQNATFRQAYGTYTQYGIQLGAEELLENEDTTYTQILHSGTEYQKDVTVVRKPVMILLSDGDPTHCTPNYTDVLNGPHYGDGGANSNNNQGVLGYYTILTANYFKRMVGIHYGIPASFFTIGLGINAEGTADSSGSSHTGDHYKRAVLNPSAVNIAALDSSDGTYHENTAWQLRDLLKNADGRPEFVTVRNQTTNFEQLGNRPQTRVPIIDNPYAGNYSYADGSYFGHLDAEKLTKIFSDIITSNIKIKTYGFMLNQLGRNGAKVTLADPIGEGMEVNMDPGQRPILRYNGKNYAATSVTTSGNVTTLVYDYIAVTEDGSGGTEGERMADLKEITVTVTTDESGKQTVNMQVPESVLPSYTPGPDNSGFYYEELPVRLIYKIRLTEASKAAVRDLTEDDGELVFYTNEWGDETGAFAAHTPHRNNPYYCDVTYYKEDGTVDDKNPARTHVYVPYANEKSANPTGTAEQSANSTARLTSTGAVVDDSEVYVALGNNGKLVFKASSGMDLAVNKLWQDEDGNELADPEVDSITLQLMQNGAPFGAPVTVSAEDGWMHLFTDLPKLDSSGEPYTYTLEELAVFGYSSDVSVMTFDPADGINEITVTNRKLHTTDLPVEKRWASGSHDGDSVTVHLYANGVDTGLSKVLSQSNHWHDIFTDIPAEDADGAAIVYTLREDPVPGYTASYSEGDIDLGSITWTQVAASSAFSADEVYQIRSSGGYALADVNGSLQLVTQDDTDTAQQWKLSGTGSTSICNVSTGRYILLSAITEVCRMLSRH